MNDVCSYFGWSYDPNARSYPYPYPNPNPFPYSLFLTFMLVKAQKSANGNPLLYSLANFGSVLPSFLSHLSMSHVNIS